jgi:hypothetical protein
MIWLQTGLLLFGFILLGIGYGRNHRNTLLVSALTLCVAAGSVGVELQDLRDFHASVLKGMADAEAAHHRR